MWRIKTLRQSAAAACHTLRHGKSTKIMRPSMSSCRHLHSQKAAVVSCMEKQEWPHHASQSMTTLAAFGLGALTLTTVTYMQAAPGASDIPLKEENAEPGKVVPGAFKPDLPTYTLADVASHVSTKGGGVWVVYKSGVYDVSKFIGKHPGGSKILLAAGKSIEPFWQIYAAHNHADVHVILEGLRVGNLDPADVQALEEERLKKYGDGPYANDPERNPLFKVNASQPFNAEPPAELLTESFITPNDLFFVRNHLPVPDIDASTFKLEIAGLGVRSGTSDDIDVNHAFWSSQTEPHAMTTGNPDQPNTVAFTLDELKKTFNEHTIVTTLQCAGNRRAEMSAVKPVKGLSWDTTAVSTATWTGVLLSEVLAYIGVSEEQHCRAFPSACPTCANLPLTNDYPSECSSTIEHCHLEGLDKDVTGQSYGASIPISTALDPRKDVLLAYSMNGEPIPRDHGFPLRAIVPGTVGARNVKFLGRIVLSHEEYPGFWQQKDYRGFSPMIDYATPDFSKYAGPSIQELPVQSAITEPKPNATWPPEGSEEADVMTIKGYAWSGGGRNIIRVDVSLDGGATWQEAALDPLGVRQKYNRAWAWTPWSLDVDIADHMTDVKLVCKAVDSSYNVQPDSIAPIWNMRGVLNNAWHRVDVAIQKPPPSSGDDDEDDEDVEGDK
ncbi:hypothetical protein B5M09_010057 [Aphanomyces astaci]|uniref:Cytochrome b5 heme-binding domain-containing protein n=1 Tax=Aphanomyces astaci TaxID=112090 RepID=A0A3R7YS92_APHAT|nr:hypothetical protein B5M09_010057 [Aphanomyces astaci]